MIFERMARRVSFTVELRAKAKRKCLAIKERLKGEKDKKGGDKKNGKNRKGYPHRDI